MAKIIEIYQFPCGLKTEVRTDSGFFLFGHYKYNYDLKDVICPLHGKNCKKN